MGQPERGGELANLCAESTEQVISIASLGLIRLRRTDRLQLAFLAHVADGQVDPDHPMEAKADRTPPRRVAGTMHGLLTRSRRKVHAHP